MGLSIDLGFNKNNAQDRLNHLMLGLMIKSVMDYEKLPSEKRGLHDNTEYWYRMALLNLTTKFSPWALQNHYKKYLANWNDSPVIRSWTTAKQGSNSFGNDRPYTISEATQLYGGGWVQYTNQWDKADTFGSQFKKVAPVVGAIVGGALAGGPVGAVIGGISGTAAYLKQGKTVQVNKALEKDELNNAIKLNAEATQAHNTLLASGELLTFDGPKLWVLSILIVFVIILFYTKKK